MEDGPRPAHILPGAADSQGQGSFWWEMYCGANTEPGTVEIVQGSEFGMSDMEGTRVSKGCSLVMAPALLILCLFGSVASLE